MAKKKRAKVLASLMLVVGLVTIAMRESEGDPIKLDRGLKKISEKYGDEALSDAYVYACTEPQDWRSWRFKPGLPTVGDCMRVSPEAIERATEVIVGGCFVEITPLSEINLDMLGDTPLGRINREIAMSEVQA